MHVDVWQNQYNIVNLKNNNNKNLKKKKVKSESEVAQSCPTLQMPWTAAHHAPVYGIFLGKSTGVGCHCLLCFTATIIYKYTYIFSSA